MDLGGNCIFRNTRYFTNILNWAFAVISLSHLNPKTCQLALAPKFLVWPSLL